MKRRDLERHLRAEGCRQLDEGGNHTRWTGPGGARSTVPRHRELRWWLVRDICKQLEVSPPAGGK